MKSVEILKEGLKNGVVTFSYQKKDGSIRVAKGTTNLPFIESNYTFKDGVNYPKRRGYTSYWDFDKNDWRCFDETCLVEIIDIKKYS